MFQKSHARHSRATPGCTLCLWHSPQGGNPYIHHEAHEETKRANKKVSSFPRRWESTPWIPAYAGMTARYNHA